jgi:hypothetical protein
MSLKSYKQSGFYREVDLPDPVNTMDEIEQKISEQLGFRAETDDRYKLLEMHVDLVIEDDDYRGKEEE